MLRYYCINLLYMSKLHIIVHIIKTAYYCAKSQNQDIGPDDFLHIQHLWGLLINKYNWV